METIDYGGSAAFYRNPVHSPSHPGNWGKQSKRPTSAPARGRAPQAQLQSAYSPWQQQQDGFMLSQQQEPRRQQKKQQLRRGQELEHPRQQYEQWDPEQYPRQPPRDGQYPREQQYDGWQPQDLEQYPRQQQYEWQQQQELYPRQVYEGRQKQEQYPRQRQYEGWQREQYPRQQQYDGRQQQEQYPRQEYEERQKQEQYPRQQQPQRQHNTQGIEPDSRAVPPYHLKETGRRAEQQPHDARATAQAAPPSYPSRGVSEIVSYLDKSPSVVPADLGRRAEPVMSANRWIPVDGEGRGGWGGGGLVNAGLQKQQLNQQQRSDAGRYPPEEGPAPRHTTQPDHWYPPPGASYPSAVSEPRPGHERGGSYQHLPQEGRQQSSFYGDARGVKEGAQAGDCGEEEWLNQRLPGYSDKEPLSEHGGPWACGQHSYSFSDLDQPYQYSATTAAAAAARAMGGPGGPGAHDVGVKQQRPASAGAEQRSGRQHRGAAVTERLPAGAQRNPAYFQAAAAAAAKKKTPSLLDPRGSPTDSGLLVRPAPYSSENPVAPKAITEQPEARLRQRQQQGAWQEQQPQLQKQQQQGGAWQQQQGSDSEPRSAWEPLDRRPASALQNPYGRDAAAHQTYGRQATAPANPFAPGTQAAAGQPRQSRFADDAGGDLSAPREPPASAWKLDRSIMNAPSAARVEGAPAERPGHLPSRHLTDRDLEAVRDAELAQQVVAGSPHSRLVGGRWAYVEDYFHPGAPPAPAKVLTSEDIARAKESSLGQHVVPGSPNAKLVGGKWRLVPQRQDQKPVWTDYYGPVGGGNERTAYYGRCYH